MLCIKNHGSLFICLDPKKQKRISIMVRTKCKQWRRGKHNLQVLNTLGKFDVKPGYWFKETDEQASYSVHFIFNREKCTIKKQQISFFVYLFIWILTSLSSHCIGHIMMGSFIDRGNQYIQLVKVLYCNLPTNAKQLPAFPLEVRSGTEPRFQR